MSIMTWSSGSSEYCITLQETYTKGQLACCSGLNILTISIWGSVGELKWGIVEVISEENQGIESNHKSLDSMWTILLPMG